MIGTTTVRPTTAGPTTTGSSAQREQWPVRPLVRWIVSPLSVILDQRALRSTLTWRLTQPARLFTNNGCAPTMGYMKTPFRCCVAGYLLAISSVLAVSPPLQAAESYAPRVGQAHPDFTLPRIEDRQAVGLADFRGKKVLLIHFASW